PAPVSHSQAGPPNTPAGSYCGNLGQPCAFVRRRPGVSNEAIQLDAAPAFVKIAWHGHAAVLALSQSEGVPIGVAEPGCASGAYLCDVARCTKGAFGVVEERDAFGLE